jgi:hypothetical protein
MNVVYNDILTYSAYNTPICMIFYLTFGNVYNFFSMSKNIIYFHYRY